eukprot:CAMPEP_0179875260 /NCGR_PEP_ID=MMETSP0982-20121206/23448_1 /TAXON_ID=483367 /ORGANISM="non described non described, Strain CCMP 2436" /LENGTH=208 /DNA_ID=CAMNT_0021767353 /DNA_START=87 /DNA_END=709 /DNA_ORIENTATION=-
MSFLFGKQKTPAERLKEYKRTIDRSMRDLDRERTTLERQEGKIKSDIKKMANAGQMDSARIMAKDLVRTRAQVRKFHKLKGHLQAVSLRLTTMQSNAAMAQAMRGVTKAMSQMNKAMNIPQMQKIMMEFEKQTDQMEMKEEIMGDAIDDAFEQSDEEEEGDALVNQVLDEIGITMGQQLASVPSAQPAAASKAAVGTAQPALEGAAGA